MLSLESNFKVNTRDILAKVLDGEAILINISNGMYHSMDKAGAVIWELIENGHSVEQVAQSVAARYDAAIETIQADVQRLSRELLQHSIIAFSSEPPLAIEVEPCNSKQPYEAPKLHSYDDMGDLLALDPPMPGVQDLS